nr:MAG TPA: Protein of unknown function (DUF1071) [Caudoviricetes sp.]
MNEKNYFTELNAINVSDKTEKKNGMTYLSWAWAWGELKKLHPDATYTVYENKDGWLYHTDGRTCWVKTGVTVNGIENIEYLPVMDFRNNSIPADKVTSYDVNKAVQRSLTKAVARHGLGLYIYAGEDLPEGEEKPQERQTEKPPKAKPTADITCTKCGVKIEPVIAKTGKTMTAQEISDFSRKKFGQCLCPACQKIENERAKA